MVNSVKVSFSMFDWRCFSLRSWLAYLPDAENFLALCWRTRLLRLT